MIQHSLVPRPLPRERAWYPLHAHALDFRGGCGYTRHSQTRERVVTKRPTITIIGGETNKTGLALLPTLPSLGSQTVKPRHPESRGTPDEDVYAMVDEVHCLSLLWLRRDGRNPQSTQTHTFTHVTSRTR